MKSIIPFLLMLVIVSCKEREQEESSQVPEITKIEKVILRNFTYDDVARYTIASVMGQKPKIIKVTKNDDLYYVSYTRKSDKQKFAYKIKFDGDKIFWANIDGRWRDSKYDEKISFVEKGNKLSIIQTFSDDSEDVQVYNKGE
ncbi:hypothetical protein [Flavobacterium sp. 2]|uniref:hypothetical protein n=1 Tax=Flavobacterium sp. 2 TaxID=308053 RepID=UPI000C19E23A|nr:hypothetical protein [Flavobacterium sp. 2]PIF60044.1 hypothetical protein CLU99_3289 [Flavobacterium sp. 2]